MESYKNIDISKIIVEKNSRFRIEDDDLTGLMVDIKQRGLLQPLGIFINTRGQFVLRFGNRRLTAAKKLGWKTVPCIVIDEEIKEEQFIADNVAENIHRENLTPIEFASVCERFMDMGYNKGEIATKLNVSKNKIEASLLLMQKVPLKYKDDVRFGNGNKNLKGKISAATASAITNIGKDKDTIHKLFQYSKKKELSYRNIVFINELLKKGYSVPEAMRALKDYTPGYVVMWIKNDVLKDRNLGASKAIIKVMIGEEEPFNKEDIVMGRR